MANLSNQLPKPMRILNQIFKILYHFAAKSKKGMNRD